MAESRGFQRDDYREMARLIMVDGTIYQFQKSQCNIIFILLKNAYNLSTFLQFLAGADAELQWSGKVGPIHHARWMAAVIAALKTIICGEDRFQIGQRQAKGLLDVAFFVICIYRRY